MLIVIYYNRNVTKHTLQKFLNVYVYFFDKNTLSLSMDIVDDYRVFSVTLQ